MSRSVIAALLVVVGLQGVARGQGDDGLTPPSNTRALPFTRVTVEAFRGPTTIASGSVDASGAYSGTYYEDGRATPVSGRATKEELAALAEGLKDADLASIQIPPPPVLEGRRVDETLFRVRVERGDAPTQLVEGTGAELRKVYPGRLERPIRVLSDVEQRLLTDSAVPADAAVAVAVDSANGDLESIAIDKKGGVVVTRGGAHPRRLTGSLKPDEAKAIREGLRTADLAQSDVVYSPANETDAAGQRGSMTITAVVGGKQVRRSGVWRAWKGKLERLKPLAQALDGVKKRLEKEAGVDDAIRDGIGGGVAAPPGRVELSGDPTEGVTRALSGAFGGEKKP